MKTPEDEAFDELEKSLQRKVATGVTDGNKKDAALRLAREALENSIELFISIQEFAIRNGMSAKDARVGETFIADRAIKAIDEALEDK